MLNKDELEGKGKKVKGTVKEEVGKVIGNRNLQEEGQADRQEGEIEEGFGKARRKVGEVVEKVGKAISR